MKNALLVCLTALLFASCKKDPKNDPQYVEPLPDKIIKIEIDLAGSYQNHEIFIGINSLITQKGRYVGAKITIPANAEWTGWTDSPSTFYYIKVPTNNKIVIESKTGAGVIDFFFKTTQLHNVNDSAQLPLTATITVFGDGEVVQRYKYRSEREVNSQEWAQPFVGFFTDWLRVGADNGFSPW